MKYVYTFLILAPIIIGLLLIDDELNPEILEMRARIDQNRRSESHAFTYLMGMGAAEDEDPMVIGKQRLDLILREEAFYDEVYKNPDYFERDIKAQLGDPKLAAPTDDLLCKFENLDCLNKIEENAEKLDALLDKYRVTLSRYKTFISFNDYKVPFKPDSTEYLASHSYVLSGNKLFLLELFNQAVINHKKISFREIENQILQIRTSLQKQESLVYKMIMLASLQITLDFSAYMFHRGYLDENGLLDSPSLSDLTSDELFIDFSREQYGFDNIIINTKDILHEPEGTKREIASSLLRPAFKRNMTRNNVYNLYKEISGHSRLSHKQIYTTHSNYGIESKYSIRNIVGDYMVNVGKPDFWKYILRVYNAELKLRLVKLLSLSGHSAAISISNFQQLAEKHNINNPYYDKKESMFVLRDKRLCFKSPLEDKFYMHCLNLLISDDPELTDKSRASQ